MLYGKICLGVIVLLEVIDFAFKDWRPIIYSDKGIIEGLIVAMALGALILAGKIMLQNLRKAWLPYVPIFALNIFLLLEEISFGQEFIGFQSIKFGGVYFDSTHDVFSLVYKHLGTYILILFLIGVFLIVKNYRRLIAPVLEKYPPYRLVALGFVILGISVLFDLNMIYRPPAEEYLEMLGILGTFLAHLDIGRVLKKGPAEVENIAESEPVG